jgi:hypothetical protein
MQSADRVKANELADRYLEILKALWGDRLLACASSIALQ